MDGTSRFTPNGDLTALRKRLKINDLRKYEYMILLDKIKRNVK
jgi:hypothetical protein